MFDEGDYYSSWSDDIEPERWFDEDDIEEFEKDHEAEEHECCGACDNCLGFSNRDFY